MFSLIGDLVGFATKRALPFLGKLGKGKATGAGVVAAVTGVLAQHSGAVVTDQNIVAILHELGGILVALGTVVGSFGFGRKAVTGG